MDEGLRDLLVGDWWRYTISVLGTVMLAFGVGSLLLDAQLTDEELLQGGVLIGACLLLIAAGARIALEVRSSNQMAIILGWLSLGVLVTGTMGVWGIVVLPTVRTDFAVALIYLSVLATGALVGAIVGYYDVRVRALSAQAGQERARREFLDDQQETLSSLNGILHHQILNDLGAISGRAELLAAGRIDDENATDSILDHCEHMEMTIDRIDTLVEILTHVSDTSERDLQDVVVRARSVARESNPSLSVEIAGDGTYTVLADKLLHLALAELFDNSATHADGEVTVSFRESVDTVELAVSDSGPGVSLQEATLFEPNTRGPDSDGDGLGLYFAALIVDRYGGQISLADCSGGATFVVELPTDSQRLPDPAEDPPGA